MTNSNISNQSNILIVDDTPENLQVLSATLSERGYKIRGVVNGKMAIRAARSAQPDLILLDIRMPDMSGYEVCQIIKNEPQCSDIPVIFISALDEVLDKVKAFKVGGVDYITKPFQVEEVLARVEHQLTIRRLQQQLLTQNQQLQQEIIERKKAEEAAEAASRSKSQFLANMSHELRTPLNAILGFTQLMLREIMLTPEQVENLRIINRSGEHLLDLINDILDLSKIESGVIELYETTFDLYRLLDGLEEMFQINCERKSLLLKVQVQPNVPQYIKTDEKKLRVCLINLIANAIKFTDRGVVTLRVTTIPPDANCENSVSCQIAFEVEDTGVGISPQEMDILFNAFVQTESGRKAAEGTGLGLTITRKFVEMMGGEISVNSLVNKGSIFFFYIQTYSADFSEIQSQPLRRVIGIDSSCQPQRILIVDDTKENRLLMMKLLEPLGFEVREAENGAQAIIEWQRWHPHIIWMDTRMPVMDGLEATRQIRDREKERMAEDFSFSPTVILALTASTFEEKRGEILAAGFDDFVRKPFQESVIFNTMAQYTKLRYLYEELPPNPIYSSRNRYLVSEKSDSFFLPLLSQMPRIWLEQLYQAANEVNEDWIFHLLEEIPLTSMPLQEALKDLLHDFRLDTIVRLTKAILQSWEQQ